MPIDLGPVATIVGILPLVAADDRVRAALVAERVDLGAAIGPQLFVEVARWSVADTLASRVSRALAAPVLAVAGQTSADSYLIAEHDRGELARRITYDRDGGGWQEPVGAPRAWEIDLHFALSVEDFLDRLTDWEWSEADLAAARRAHAARSIDALPRLPPLSGGTLDAFLKALGVDLRRHASARHTTPGLLARLLGRR